MYLVLKFLNRNELADIKTKLNKFSVMSLPSCAKRHHMLQVAWVPEFLSSIIVFYSPLILIRLAFVVRHMGAQVNIRPNKSAYFAQCCAAGLNKSINW